MPSVSPLCLYVPTAGIPSFPTVLAMSVDITKGGPLLKEPKSKNKRESHEGRC